MIYTSLEQWEIDEAQAEYYNELERQAEEESEVDEFKNDEPRTSGRGGRGCNVVNKIDEELDRNKLTYEGERLFYKGAKAMLFALVHRGVLSIGEKPVKAYKKNGEKVKISDKEQLGMIDNAIVRKCLTSQHFLENYMNGGNFIIKWYVEKDTNLIKVIVYTEQERKEAIKAALDLAFDITTGQVKAVDYAKRQHLDS